jgi:ferric-dicitrate binding protein FerR (iron transport regulator)
MTSLIDDKRSFAEQYLLGILDAAVEEDFERRLGEDDELLEELVRVSREEAGLRRALQTFADNRMALVDAPTPVRTIHAVREPRRRPVPVRRRRTAMWLGWAVAAAVTLFFGVLFMNRGPETPAPRVVAPRVVTPSPEVDDVVIPDVPEPEAPRPALAKDTGIASVMGVVSDVGIRRGVQKLPCAKGMTLREGDWIATGADGKVFVSYRDDAARLTVGAGSSVHMAESIPSKRIEVAAGTVRASVSRTLQGAPLAIQTPHADMIVKGTLFDATARKDVTTVAVLKGLVGVKGAVSGTSVDVEAGQVATVDKDGRITVEPIKDEIVEGNRKREFSLPREMTQPVTCVDDGSVLWVGDRQQKMLYKLDPADGRLIGKISVGYLGEYPTLCDWDGKSLWIHSAGKIHAVDPRDGKLRRTLELPIEEGWRIIGSAIHGNTLWQFVRPVDNKDHRQKMFKVSLETGKIMSVRDIEPKMVNRVTCLNGKLWLRRNVMIEKLDLDTGAVLGSFKGPAIHHGDVGDDGVGSVWLVTKSSWKAYLVDTGERPWKK